MKRTEFQIFISVESYDEKLLKMNEIDTLQEYPQFLTYRSYQFQMLIAQIGKLSEDWDCVKISGPYLL